MPVGDPDHAPASLKNKVIDAAIKLTETQVRQDHGRHRRRGGPNVFHPYAYNGIFCYSAFLKDHPDTARAIVAASV